MICIFKSVVPKSVKARGGREPQASSEKLVAKFSKIKTGRGQGEGWVRVLKSNIFKSDFMTDFYIYIYSSTALLNRVTVAADLLGFQYGEDL